MTSQETRRDLIGTATAVVTAATLASLPSTVQAQTTSGAPRMDYTPKKLPFDPAKVKGFSEKLLVSHYENNYGGAVKRLNAISAQLAGLDMATAPVFVVNGLKREELIAANSMILHELYFDSLNGEGEPTPHLQREEMQFYPGEVVRQGFRKDLFNGMCGGCHGSVSGKEYDIAVNPDILTQASSVIALDNAPEDLTGIVNDDVGP